MKKKYSLLPVLLTLFIGFSFAQAVNTWNPPMMEGYSLEDIETAGGIGFFIYNVGQDAFLNKGGGGGGAQLCVMDTGLATEFNVDIFTIEGETRWRLLFQSLGQDGFIYRHTSAQDHAYVGNTSGSSNNLDYVWKILPVVGKDNVYHITFDWETWEDSNGNSLDPEKYEGMYLAPSVHVERASKDAFNLNVKTNRKYNTEWIFCLQDDIDKFDAKVELDKMLYIGDQLGLDITSAINTYDTGETNQIKAATATLKTVISNFSGTISGDVDMTGFIQNPEVEGISQYENKSDVGHTSGWTGYFLQMANNNQNQASATNPSNTDLVDLYPGATSNLLLGKSVSAAAETPEEINMYQEIDGLPAGLYTLNAYSRSTSAPETYIYVEVSSGKEYKTATPNSGKSGGLASGWEHTAVEGITLSKDDAIRIGLKGQIPAGGTVNADNFTLTFHGASTTPVFYVSLSSLTLTDTNPTAVFTLTGLNLTQNVELTVSEPGILLDGQASLSVSAADVLVDKTITVSFDESALTDSKLFNTITISTPEAAGSKTIDVTVSADSKCFTVPAGNLMPDPCFASFTAAKYSFSSGFGSYGSLSSEDAYCGAYSLKATGHKAVTVGIATKWDYEEYYFEAMVKTYNSGWKFCFDGIGTDAVLGELVGRDETFPSYFDELGEPKESLITAKGNFPLYIEPTNGEWVKISGTFTPGLLGDYETARNVYFNNSEADATLEENAEFLIYIDNWVFGRTSGSVGVPSVSSDNTFNVYSTSGAVIIMTEKVERVNVFSVTGQLVKQINVAAGETIVPLNAGIYIVNGKKAIVR